MIPDKAPKEDVFHAGGDLKKDAHVPNFEKYKELYLKSIEHSDEFWGDIAKDFYWKSKHTGQFMDYNFDVTKGEIYIKCMEGATTNICYNVLDRNVHERRLGDKVAFYWCVCQKGLWRLSKHSLVGHCMVHCLRRMPLWNNWMEC